jgi:hypothetical protein
MRRAWHDLQVDQVQEVDLQEKEETEQHVQGVESVAGIHYNRNLEILTVTEGVLLLWAPRQLKDTIDDQFGDHVSCILNLDCQNSRGRNCAARLK